jgi:hypothetical protein
VLASCSSCRCSPSAALVPSRGCSPIVVPPQGHRRAPCTAVDLRIGVELRNDEPPSSKQQGDIVLESVGCKHMFRVFQMFQRCVASVSHRCCKSRLRCCTCWFHMNFCNACNGYTRGFQVFSVVSQVFQTHIASVLTVSNICCKCFL